MEGLRPRRASERLPPNFGRFAPCSRFPAKAPTPVAHPLLAARQGCSAVLRRTPTSRPAWMGRLTAPRWMVVVGWLAVLIMALVTIGFFVLKAPSSQRKWFVKPIP
ncbi:hypothetical protein GCM10010869_37040 [Mesorhizobium tianshanense]|nr:hypothetical protein GCM10010869_37040 [Mesorhizobium tianshanense]